MTTKHEAMREALELIVSLYWKDEWVFVEREMQMIEEAAEYALAMPDDKTREESSLVVPAGWRDDVELAAQMLTWGQDEGFTAQQSREVAAHQKKLFSMLAAAPQPEDQYGPDIDYLIASVPKSEPVARCRMRKHRAQSKVHK